MERVRDFLQSHGDSRFEDQDQPERRPTPNKAGCRRRTRHGREYLINTGTFRKEICQGLDHRAVARLLRDRGALRTEAADKLVFRHAEMGRVYCVIEDKLNED